MLPEVAGYRFRMFASDADYEPMSRMIAKESDEEHLEFYPSAEWLKNAAGYLSNYMPQRDVLFAEDEASGDAVAYVRVTRAEQTDGTRRYGFALCVPPSRRELMPAMWRWMQAHARELDAGLAPNSNTVIETWVNDAQIPLKQFVESEACTAVRWGYEMTRSLDDVTPIPDFALPEGFEIRPAKPEHYRAIWDADVEAFRDHNGFTEPDESRYEAWLNDPQFFQPELWKVAWHVATNEIAGMVQNFINHEENAKLNRKRGYTENISTRRPFRKRGLARALICESLRMHKALGMTEAALGVDATNPTGALRVYEDCGFKPVKTEIVYRKLL
jgi:ribosomal protein S18 acetylase RimI-like enzyme